MDHQGLPPTPESTAAVSFLLDLGVLASRRNRQARARR